MSEPSIDIDDRTNYAVVTLTVGEQVERWHALPQFDGLGWVYNSEAIGAEARRRIERMSKGGKVMSEQESDAVEALAGMSQVEWPSLLATVAELDRQVLLATMMPSALVMGMDSAPDCPCLDCQERKRRADLGAMVKARFDEWVSGKGGKGMSEGRIRRVYVLDVVTGSDDTPPADEAVSDAYSKWVADQRRWWRADCREEGTRTPIMLRGSGDVPVAVRTAWQHGRTLEVTAPDGVAFGHDGLVVE